MKFLTLAKCCCCLPLRQGLIVWAYVRLVVCILVEAMLVYLSARAFQRVSDSYDDAVTFLECVAAALPELLDFLFTMTLIIAVHKKSIKLVEVYYYYALTLCGVYALAVGLALGAGLALGGPTVLHDMLFHHGWFLKLDRWTLPAVGVVNILLQVYLTVLVRSLARELEGRRKAQLAKQKSCASFRGLPNTNVCTNV